MTRPTRPAKYTDDDLRLIGAGFLDILIHEVLKLPGCIEIDWQANRIICHEAPTGLSGSQRGIYTAIASKAVTPAPAHVIDILARQQPDHACIRALQCLHKLYAQEGLDAVGKFLTHNAPDEKGVIKQLMLTQGEIRSFSQVLGQDRDRINRYSRRGFLRSVATGLGAAALLHTVEEKRHARRQLYTLLESNGGQHIPMKSAPALDIAPPSAVGIRREEFANGRTWCDPTCDGQRYVGVTAFDLHPPVVFPMMPEDAVAGIHGTGWDYDFPAVSPEDIDNEKLDAHNRTLLDAESRYLWMHTFVQPWAALLTACAASGAVYDGAQLAGVRHRYGKALAPLVESMSLAIGQVNSALQAEQLSRNP